MLMSYPEAVARRSRRPPNRGGSPRWPLRAARSFNIRVIAAPPPPEFELNINRGAWWPNSTRTDMSYSNAHLHTNGRCIELCWAQHSRAPGDHTSVRWTDFTANGPPTLGYYWPENDPLIAETDNFPSLYMPWRQWVCYWNQKVIDIGAARRSRGTRPKTSGTRWQSGIADATAAAQGQRLDLLGWRRGTR